MSSTRKHTEILSRLRLPSLNLATVPIGRVARKISVACNKKMYKPSARLVGKLTKDEVALASAAWPLPFEVTNYEVAKNLSRWDILNLGLTNKAMLSFVLPTLYTSVNLRSNKRCRDCLQFLISRPDIAGCVKSLVIVPNYLESYNKRLLKEEIDIAMTLERVIPNLHSLLEFRWDGLELPKDDIWLTLRTHCPLLKTIGTSTGRNDFNANSELFAFDDLLSFSLSANMRGPTACISLPKPLIQMLLLRCPDLEELTIGSWEVGSSVCLNTFNGHPLTSGIWPKLRVLNLNHAEFLGWTFDWTEDEEQAEQNSKKAAIFLLSFPNLQEAMGMPLFTDLILHIKFSLPLTSASIDCLSMVNVDTSSLNTIEVPYVTNDLLDIIITGPAEGFPAVTTFTMCIDLGNDSVADSTPWIAEDDHKDVITRVLRQCPQLMHFRIMCMTLPSKRPFHWMDLSVALRGSKLQSLELHKFDDPNDTADIINVATQLAFEYPSLESMTFRSMQDNGPRRAPFNSTAVCCTVSRGGYGTPRRVIGHEWYRTWSGHMASRKFSRDLIPSHNGPALKMLEGGSASE